MDIPEHSSILAALSLQRKPIGTAEVTVMISGGFRSTCEALAPAFEKATGCRLLMVPGPSMGTTHDAIPLRLARGEPADVLIMVGTALDDLLKRGDAVAGSKADVALSPIGMAVRARSAVPDIGTADKLRQVLLHAKSIAYSDSASGAYVEHILFQKLGIEKEIRDKAHKINATPVGEIVAQGKAELGFQEVAELLPVPGITFAGPLPADVQLLTMFSAAVAKRSRQPELATDFVAYLASPETYPVLKQKGLKAPR